MPRLFHPLLKMITHATHRELAGQVQYLKVENEILRSKLPKRITVTPAEKARLVKFGRKVGSAIRELITIVTPRTFARWVSGGASKPGASKRKPGRPRTSEEIRDIILRIAEETGWGYTRILGELKKLGIHSVGRTTVRKILIEAGHDPGPTRGEGTWDEFLKIHAKTLWATDFLSKKVWTLGGLVDYYMVFFINVETRRVIMSAATAHPTNDWVTQQARNFVMEAEEQGFEIRHVIHDCDTKYTQRFDRVFESDGVEVHQVGPAQPNMNAFAERFVQSIQQEALDHFVVLGEKHLNHIANEYLVHYHEERPHQALGNAPPVELKVAQDGEVVCRERLGGLLRHYHRKAA
ncbi:integrase core domain-containing protein [Phycisphaerales bacterium AB-hyl4]|uniref:Integrase core domain-containing protein n=1 Tax=Natronomicrosphaera hydrolytica TaxID=3242702 RepID=A0ABV4U7W7_9BACT